MTMTGTGALEEPTMRLFIRPAWSGSNPYTAMFANALADAGFAVAEMPPSPFRYPARAGIVVLHWPDEFFAAGSRHHELRAWALLARMRIGRLRGQRIVWVVHNLRPHDRAGPAPRRTALFLGTLAGAVYLSDASRRAAVAHYPALAAVPAAVVAHGDYHAVAQARPAPASPSGGRAVRIALTGQIRRYKGADLLMRAATALPAGTVRLTLAGQCDDPALAAELRARAAGLAGTVLRLDYLDAAALEAVTDGCDAVVLPYRAILNSGSALYALSRARPVIAPRLGSLAELQAQVGADWLFLYAGELDADTLHAAVRWVRETPRPAPPDLSAHAWPRIAATLADFFRRLASRSPAGRPS